MKVYYVAGNNWWTDTTSGSIASAKRTEAKIFYRHGSSDYKSIVTKRRPKTDHWYNDQIKQCSNNERNFQITRRYRLIT